MFDFVLVGAGLFSLSFTRFINKLDKTAIIFEKRNVIGGNCISSNLYNLNVNEYGPHIFHTNNKNVWNIFNEIYPVTNYIHKVYSNVTEGDYKGIYNFPINLLLLNKIYGVQTPNEANELLKSFNKKQNCNSFEEKTINMVGEKLYNIFFKGYTQKQWKVSPSILSPSILNRIPLRINFNDCYYNDIYCGIPKENNWEGFINNIIEKNINEIHYYSTIDINKLGELRSYKKNNNSKIIITSPIDEFFEYKFGKLDYLRTEFDTEYININDFQGCSVMNYPSLNIKYIRITEYKHFDQNCKNEGTIIQKEYPSRNEKNPKMYPVLTEDNINLYNKYKEYASENYKDLIFAGRLGEYKYYDMDDTIENAYNLVEKIV